MVITVEDAQTELQQILAWFEDYNQRQALVSQYQIRAGFLQGFIAAREPEEPAPAEAEPESPQTAKRQTRK